MKGRPRGTDGSLLGSLPWTLGALVASVTPHVPFLPIWITATLLGCAAWRYYIEMRRRPLPSSWLRAVLALGCFLGVLATYSSISGVGPGSALLAVMAALKLLETRKRRDQFVLLFLSIFLVMSALLREQYVWSLPYMVAAVLVIMTAWLRMSAGASQTARQSFAAGSRLLGGGARFRHLWAGAPGRDHGLRHGTANEILPGGRRYRVGDIPVVEW